MMYFAKLFNETKALYSGYSISPVMSYTRRNGSYLQYKMGYDQSFNEYHKKEIFVEVGYTIPIDLKRKEEGSIVKSF